MLQKTTNGNLLKVTAGDLAKECCCGGASPSSCPSGNPEMYVTVFDADYAGGDLTWCGEVWTQADVQAGVKKGPVCPTTYKKSGFRTTVTTPTFGTVQQISIYAVAEWDYDTPVGGDGSLRLYRRMDGNGTDFGFLSGGNRVTVKPNGVAANFMRRFFNGVWSFSYPGGATTTGTSLVQSGGVTEASAVGRPRFSGGTYNIIGDPPLNSPATFFGEHLIGGILYRWEKGNGW